MKELTENKTFEQKMMDKVKDSIGDLMSDDDLKKIVDKGMEEVFFKERMETTGSGYHSNTTSKPPLVESMLKELMTEKVRKAVEDNIASNADAITKQIDKVIKDGINEAITSAMNAAFNNSLSQLQFNITSDLNQMLANRGL